MHSAVEVIFPLDLTQPPPSSILPSSVHKSIFQKRKIKTKMPKPKPKQKTIENLAARSKNSAAF
jgi:ribosomal protein L17